MGAILVWLFFMVISILILRWIITVAINDSELAKDMKEIKEILQKRDGRMIETESVEQDSSNSARFLDGALQEACPACGAQVLSTDPTCRSCGLTLNNHDHEGR